ncbi:hypothetical protein EB001_07245 [bacterium]|nr:hypothetical protein [bacterium]
MINNFPGGEGGILDYFLVVNKAGDDSESHDGSMRLMNPRTMNPENVNDQDMGFSGSMFNPSQFGQQSFPGRLDPGTLVYGLKVPGQNRAIILGQAQTQKKAGSGTGGGGGNDLNSGFQEVFSNELPINTPPDIQESTTADGVKIRKATEKGEKHSFSLLEGLPSHGALFDMAGFRLPELPNVPTAKQQNTGMMNMNMMEQMMGQIMSMSQMFQGLMGNRGGGGGGGGMGMGGGLGASSVSAYAAPSDSPMATILQALTPEMRLAVANLSRLVQGLETTDGVAFFTGNVVHEPTYLKNAEELLSQVTSIDDLMYVLQRLQWDTSLFGHDQLTNVVTELETAWGTALQEVTYDGEIIVTYKDQNKRDFTYSNTKILVSNTGTIANVTSITTDVWLADLYNLEKTIGLYPGIEITNEIDITGSFGSNNGIYTVSQVIDETTIKFKAKGGTIPHAGNVGGIYLLSYSATPVGGAAEAEFAYNMGASSPGVGSSPSGAGGSGGGSGGGGGLGNMFGKGAQQMQDMFKRLSQGGEKEATKMHQKLNQDKFPKKASGIAEDTVKGKSPLEKFKQQGV